MVTQLSNQPQASTFVLTKQAYSSADLLKVPTMGAREQDRHSAAVGRD